MFYFCVSHSIGPYWEASWVLKWYLKRTCLLTIATAFAHAKGGVERGTRERVDVELVHDLRLPQQQVRVDAVVDYLVQLLRSEGVHKGQLATV